MRLGPSPPWSLSSESAIPVNETLSDSHNRRRQHTARHSLPFAAVEQQSKEAKDVPRASHALR